MRTYQWAVLLHGVLAEIEAQVRRDGKVHRKALLADALINEILKDLEPFGGDADEGQQL